ncbi:hypothetical protein ACFL6Y_11805 [Elusimicrobiota bacterium]
MRKIWSLALVFFVALIAARPQINAWQVKDESHQTYRLKMLFRAFDQTGDFRILKKYIGDDFKYGIYPILPRFEIFKEIQNPDLSMDGSVSSCDYYREEGVNTGCKYAHAAYYVCKVGNYLCGKSDGPANQCIRKCLMQRYVLDKNTEGCYKRNRFASCPTRECLYYDHRFCFAECKCDNPNVPL